MSTPTLQSEDIGWALIDAINEHLPDRLTEVYTRRTRRPLPLPVPSRVDMGFDETILDTPFNEFPRVSIAASPRGNATDFQSDRVSFAPHRVIIDWVIFVYRDGRAFMEAKMDAQLVAFRYGEALLWIVTKKSPFAGFKPENNVPPVDEIRVMGIVDPDRSDEYIGALGGGTLDFTVTGMYSF